jgi:hypothetical protein
MIKIMQTKEYSMFRPNKFNRDVEKTKELEASMRCHGWIDAYPMHVHQNGGRQYIIKAGNHRFYVAQKLGLPVKFVVCNDKATIHELEGATRVWKMKDYLKSFCRLDKLDYLVVKEYCEETGMALSYAVSMFSGKTAGTGKYNKVFQDGSFHITHTVQTDMAREIILYLKKYGVAFANTSSLVRAISRIILVPEFNMEHLKAKIKTFAHTIERKANLDQYLDMLEELYNKQSRQKIPLKFLAIEEAKKRNPVKRK